MKKIFPLIVCLFLFPLLSFAQPERVWATYYGKYNLNQGTKVTASVFDPVSGCVYVAGTTSDTAHVATPGSFRSSFHPVSDGNGGFVSDIFLAKLDTIGNCIWATYYGSDSFVDNYPSLAVDASGDVYLAGKTSSTTGISTMGDALVSFFYRPFLAKFNSSGQRQWGRYAFNTTYQTGIYSSGVGLAVDLNNNVYLSHATMDTVGIATPGAFKVTTIDTGISGAPDAFIMKFNPQGVKLWGTYYGGIGWDEIDALCVDAGNNLYALGYTQSANGIATPGADVTIRPQYVDYSGFIVKFNPEGQRVWGTYVPGNNGCHPYDIIVDRRDLASNIYIAGFTYSDSGIATPNAHQMELHGDFLFARDAFLMKYNSSGQRQWGTYFGGEDDELIEQARTGILSIDYQGQLFMVGSTRSDSNMTKGCPYPAVHKEGFISKWKTDGTLTWSSYYDAQIYSVASFKKSASFIVTGSSIYDSLATNGVYQTTKTPNKISGVITKFVDHFTCPEFEAALNNDNGILATDTGFFSYQWYVNGAPVAGAEENTYTPQTDGNYYVTLTNECGCIYTSDTINVDLQTTIKNARHTAEDYKLFPSPNKGKFQLAYISANKVQYNTFVITDIAGRVLQQGSLLFKNGSKADFDLTNIEPGIYFLQLSGKEGNAVLKFVVNR